MQWPVFKDELDEKNQSRMGKSWSTQLATRYDGQFGHRSKTHFSLFDDEVRVDFWEPSRLQRTDELADQNLPLIQRVDVVGRANLSPQSNFSTDILEKDA